MTFAAVSLLIVSAFIHASWNMIGKRENSSPVFFLQAGICGGLCLLPVALANLPMVGQIPGKVWVLLAVTGLFQAVYYCGLAGAYRSGHLSVAYPLARSAPVVLVALISLLLGKEKELTTAAMVGMGLITVGGLALPVGKLSEWKLRDYMHASTLFALMAAMGTAGYSIVDDSALRILRAGAGEGHSRVTLTLVYAFLETVCSAIWMALIVTVGACRSEKGPRFRDGLGSAALAGVGITLAYALVLIAMTFARNVSYIVAFRQLSIPIGATLGMTLLHEPRNPMKLIGISIMLAGLVLVAVK